MTVPNVDASAWQPIEPVTLGLACDCRLSGPLLDPDTWDEFQRELREAFDRRDGLHFEIVLSRLERELT